MMIETQRAVDDVVADHQKHVLGAVVVEIGPGQELDDDAEAGSATLMALTQAPVTDGAWKFQLADFPVEGEWAVAVTQDLDGDGAVVGALETEGSLVRITISFNQERILSTVRGKETQT